VVLVKEQVVVLVNGAGGCIDEVSRFLRQECDERKQARRMGRETGMMNERKKMTKWT
ncbi:hypothetical protein K457DRAFT_138877, partial [Linnemannia elongata AG-77]